MEAQPTLIDRLKSCKRHWTAWSDAEAALCSRMCWEHANGNHGKACQMMAAYQFIASKRDNRTGTATVTDDEIARVVPRLRKPKGNAPVTYAIGADSYRKGVKRDLRACGLVSCESASSRNGRTPTVYSFPALEKELSGNASASPPTDAISNGYSDCSNSAAMGAIPEVIPGHSEQPPVVSPLQSGQLSGLTPPSLGTGLQERKGCSEEWNNSTPVVPGNTYHDSPVSLQCPTCDSRNLQEHDYDRFQCCDCGLRFEPGGGYW